MPLPVDQQNAAEVLAAKDGLLLFYGLRLSAPVLEPLRFSEKFLSGRWETLMKAAG